MAGPRSIVRLRRALLALLVLLVAGLAVLYWFGRSGLERPPKVAIEEGELPADDLTFAGKDFDFSYEEGGRTIFALHGDDFRRDREGNVVVDQLAVRINTAQGDTFEVEGKQGTYNQETQEAVLESGVKVKSPSGIELETSKLQMTQKGRAILGQEPMTFRYLEKAQGRADRMRADLDERLFILAGNVRVDNGADAPGPFRIRAGRLYLDRNQHHARADGDVFVSFLSHRLRAPRINLWLTEDDQTVQFVRAVRGVRGRLGLQPSASAVCPVRFAGRTLSAIFAPDTGDLARFELGSNAAEPATVISTSPGEPARRLGASFINGNLEGGNLTRAEALGGVKLAELATLPPEEAWDAAAEAAPATEPVEESGEDSEESEAEAAKAAALANDSVALDELDRGALRLATGRRAEASFGPDGQLVEVTLYERVDFRDPQFHAVGDQVRFDYGNGIGEFLGKPVRATSARGTLTAPRLLYTQRTGLLVAQAGVRAQLQEETGAGVLGDSPLAEGEGPIFVESQEAFFRGSSRSFLFRGKVKAWRGESLVLADELKGDEDTGQLTATGNVRTVTKQQSVAPPRGATAPQPPVEVTAASMLYGKVARTIVYRTGVQAVQGQRALSCDELTIELDDRQKLQALVLTGNAKIEDRETGRTVVGDRARYEPGAKTVTVEGERATMRDRDGAEVTGQRIVYEFETGKAQVTGAPPEPPPVGSAGTGSRR